MDDKNFSDLNINCQENGTEIKTEAITTSSNISSEEIDKETIEKLRGDAIGDTMYSQSSVIRVLLQLSDVEWNKQLEEDLCFLWDMTVEGDVCEYLYHLSFPSIAGAIILKYSEPRLIEIIIGILGNICSNKEIVPDITDVEISIVLNAMDTDDHLILTQIMRFLTALTYHRSKLDFITPDIVGKICFILKNSTNKELLVRTMETLKKITDNFKIEVELLNADIVTSLLIAHDYVTKEHDLGAETDEENKSTHFFMETILNICMYINAFPKLGIYEEITTKNDELLDRFKSIIEKFSHKDILLPLTEEIEFYFESFNIIFPVLSLKYDAEIFRCLFDIIDILTSEATIEDIDCFVELTRYIISVSSADCLVKDVEKVNCSDKCGLFKVVLEHKSECDYDYTGKLNVAVDKLNEINK